MFRNTYPYKEDKKMKLNNFVNQESLLTIQRFGHKLSKTAQNLLASPSPEQLKEFNQLRLKYEEEMKHYFDLLVVEATNQITVLPAVALIIKGGNHASGKHSKNLTEDDSSIVIEGSLASELSKVDYVYEQGTSRGSRARNMNKTSKKQLLNQYVSTLRRILYWSNKSAEQAEAIIDMKLSQKGVSGYIKSKRKNNHIYRPVVFKKP
jgi:hypothetical protein